LKIENLAELQDVVKACRRLGVESIKVGDVEFHLGPPTPKAIRRAKATTPTESAFVPGTGKITSEVKVNTDELTEEQLLFYSARPESFEKAE
jgi:hypothetical protein